MNRFQWSSLVCLVVSLAGCDDVRTLGKPPYFAASTDVVDFGEVQVGDSETRTIFLINKGDLSMKLMPPSGALLDGVFTLVGMQETVDPGASVSVRVFFNPQSPGLVSDEITFPNDSANLPDFKLQVKGTGLKRDPCRGAACNTPPSRYCKSSSGSIGYDPNGVCNSGECEYTQLEEQHCENGCDPDTGYCKGDPCENVLCDKPPQSSCVSATVSRVYSATTCDAGKCNYPFSDDTCQFGCDQATGACKGDPCEGISCQLPPNGCFFGQGQCVNGACVYETNDGIGCSDGNPCTTGDVCDRGNCSGTPRLCTQTKIPTCVNATTLRTWEAAGYCDEGNGACVFPEPLDVTCAHGCEVASVNGVVQGTCKGNPCDTPYTDNNPCTTERCDATTNWQWVSTNADGSACSTTSEACPRGTCHAGVCRTNAGESCTKKLDLICDNKWVPGTCQGDGKCLENVDYSDPCWSTCAPGTAFCLTCETKYMDFPICF